MTASPGFRELATRLLSYLNAMVRRGEVSERGLARLTRYSQPHIHNVLKGRRTLSIELADQMMSLLHVPLASLLTQDELSGRAPVRPTNALPVPVLDGCLGGGQIFPCALRPRQQYLFPAVELVGVISPVLVRLDVLERSMWPTLWPGDLVLLDRSPLQRRTPTTQNIYALRWRNKGWIGRCRRAGRALVTVVDNARAGPLAPHTISLSSRDVLDVVRGKVVWLARALPEHGGPTRE